MGITARGAWECVKHHFRNLGIDVQNEPFTMAGIGDMAGDVFGNGAAAEPRHAAAWPPSTTSTSSSTPTRIPSARFKERERLFHLPRSSWRDYDAVAHQQGRRHLRPLGQVHPPLARR